jgi:hypothetical protein
MIKCQSCRTKDVELLTKWERFKNWCFRKVNSILFTDDFEDLKTQKYTQGFSDGTVDGARYERARFEKEKLDFQNTFNVPIDYETEVAKRMNDMLSPVDLNAIIKLDKAKGIVLIGDETVDPVRLSNLRSEAEFLLNSEIWKLLYETPKELAQRAMFVDSQSLDDMKKGKSILYTLSTQKKIIDTLQLLKKLLT